MILDLGFRTAPKASSSCGMYCLHNATNLKIRAAVFNTFHAVERGPCSSWLCLQHAWNKALILQTLLLLSWKMQPN